MSNEVKSDFAEMPKDFWNYAINPITGITFNPSTNRLKRVPTNEKR